MSGDGKIVEDRVFGLPERMPRPPLPVRRSTTTDLFSVSVEGAETVYGCDGRWALPPLVFVHGWGATHKFFTWSFGAFSPRYWCVAPDLVGFGRSEKPRRDYSMEAYAGWLGRFLDALRIERAPIVAHSMGGTIALLLALNQPERVERLVVVNPVVRGSTAFDFRSRLLSVPGLRRLSWWTTAIRPFRVWVNSFLGQDQVLDADMIDDTRAGTFASTFGSVSSLMRVDLVPRLGELRVPTLLVGTDRDRVVRPTQHDLLEGVRRETIRDCGHIPMLERPAEFNRIVDEFLSEPPEARERGEHAPVKASTDTAWAG